MANLRLNINDVQKIFYKLVEDYPTQSKDYLRPQTFAAIRYREELFDAGINKTKIYQTVTDNRGLYYNRKWIGQSNNINDMRFDFPLCFLLQNENQGGSHERPVFSFLFGLMDLRQRSSTDDTRVNEIKQNDIELIASSIIGESLNFVFAIKDGASEYEWISEDELKALKAADTITGYTIRAWFRTALKNQNNISYRRFEEENKGKKLFGCLCNLTIQGDLNTVNYSY